LKDKSFFDLCEHLESFVPDLSEFEGQLGMTVVESPAIDAAKAARDAMTGINSKQFAEDLCLNPLLVVAHV